MLGISRRRGRRAAILPFFLVPALLGAGGCGPADPGARVYGRKCAGCHGSDGRGRTKFAEGRPYADLTDGRWKHGGSHEAIVRLITEGDPKSPMPAYRGRLTPEQIEAVARYVARLSQGIRSTPPSSTGNVTRERVP